VSSFLKDQKCISNVKIATHKSLDFTNETVPLFPKNITVSCHSAHSTALKFIISEVKHNFFNSTFKKLGSKKLACSTNIIGVASLKLISPHIQQQLITVPTDGQIIYQLECGPMPNLMVALPNIGGALCSMPQSLADAHY